MAERFPLRTTMVKCPKCRVPLRLPDEFTAFVDFPDDLEELDALAHGLLNHVEHWCGASIVYAPQLMVRHAPSRAVGATFDPPAKLRQDLDGYTVTVVDDAAAVASIVGVWLGEVLRPFVGGTPDSATGALRGRAYLDQVTPTVLLAMKLLRDGTMSVQLTGTDDPGALLDAVSRHHVHLTARAVRQSVIACWDSGKPADVLDELRRAVPATCLDDAVLAVLEASAAHALARTEADDGLALISEWYLVTLVEAVGHLVAGKPNPHDAEFTDVLWLLHNSERDGHIDDPRVWLRPQVLRELVTPESVAALARGLLDDAASLQEFLTFVDRIGHETTIAALQMGMRLTPADQSAFDVEAFVDEFVDGTPSDLEGWDRGAFIGGGLWPLLAGLPVEDHVAFVDRARGRLRAEGRLVRLGFDIALCKRANEALDLAVAVKCAHAAGNAWPDVDLEPHQEVFLANELGNTMRYLSRWDDALALYDLTEQLMATAPPNGDNVRTLQRNRALVYRDSGRILEAEHLLDDLAADNPGDVSVHDSLATLHVQTGDYRSALAVVGRVLARPDLGLAERRRLKTLRSVALVLSGEASAALEALFDTVEQEPRASAARMLHLQWIARAAPPTDRGTVARVEGYLDEILDAAPDAAGAHLGIAVSAVLSLAQRRMREGDRPAAAAAYGLADSLMDPHHLPPWQHGLVAAWLWMHDDPAAARKAIRYAIGAADSSVPDAASAAKALTFVGNVDMRQLQEVSLDVALSTAALRDGMDEIIAAFDLQNGREIVSTASALRSIPGPFGLADLLAADQSRTGYDVVWVLDTPERSDLLMLPQGGEPVLVPLATRADIEAAAGTLAFLNRTNPLAPHIVDAAMAPWWRLADTFATAVRTSLPSDRPLVILPGNRLLGTPLHAAGWPADPLVLRRPVDFAISTRLLLAPNQAMTHDERVAVACPKEGDSAEFNAALESTVSRLAGQGWNTVAGPSADERALSDAVARARELIILCHGLAAASHDEGPAICVSSNGLLPPAALLIDKDPALHTFAVTWRDLLAAHIDRTPETIVSLACSTGRTLAGTGGTRLGLDQALVGRSTRHLVSPLWNVNQTSAMEWLDAYVAARESLEPVQAYRAAVTMIAAERPHPFHWAPFALSTHYRGDHDGQ